MASLMYYKSSLFYYATVVFIAGNLSKISIKVVKGLGIIAFNIDGIITHKILLEKIRITQYTHKTLNKIEKTLDKTFAG